MEAFLPILIVIFMFGALGMLVLGIATLARGGNPQRSNKLMQYRILLQGLALLVFAIFMLIFRR
jgi:hypothetical protein